MLHPPLESLSAQIEALHLDGSASLPVDLTRRCDPIILQSEFTPPGSLILNFC